MSFSKFVIFEFCQLRRDRPSRQGDTKRAVKCSIINRKNGESGVRKPSCPTFVSWLLPWTSAQSARVSVCARTYNRVRMVSMTYITRPSVTRSCTPVFPGIIQGVLLKNMPGCIDSRTSHTILSRKKSTIKHLNNNEKWSATPSLTSRA